MKASLLIIIFLALAILGGSGLFIYQRTLPDIDAIRKDIVERILTIDSLDTNINELAIRNRYNFDLNYDGVTRASSLLDKAVSDFGRTYFINKNAETDLLARRFQDFKNELEVKKELIENFKTHNSVLRNSEKYAPLVGRKLIAVADQANEMTAKEHYTEIIREMLEYSLQGSSVRLENLKIMRTQLTEVEKSMPRQALTEMIAFNNHLSVVMEEKHNTDTFLRKIMLSTTGEELSQLSNAWDMWFVDQSQKYDNFTILLTAYIVSLLAFIAIIVWILRSLYRSLDQKVEERTKETEIAFEELKEYETQLMQSEKMASLGQLVAGVTYEMNTPLGYISANVDTVSKNIKGMGRVYEVMNILSNEVSLPKPDGKKMGALLKHLVKLFREGGKGEVINETQELLEDSTYGLNEISQLVSSLKDYGSIDQSEMKSINLNRNLDTTLDMSKSLIKNRELVRNYTDIKNIKGMPSQLNQVFMNVITNAIQATDDNTGKIIISTDSDEDNVIIEIEDNGIGMREEEVKHVFDPFFTTKDVGQGVGLGMAVAYKIIKSHGGEIIVESQPSNGTKVIIKLPLNHTEN